jgi:hypothetical protein
MLNRALSAEQMRRSFLRGYARAEPGSVINLQMKEGVGLTVYDDSGYGNNGSLLNGPDWERIALYQLLAESGQ